MVKTMVGVFHFHSKIDTRPTLVVTSITLWRLELQKKCKAKLDSKALDVFGNGDGCRANY